MCFCLLQEHLRLLLEQSQLLDRLFVSLIPRLQIVIGIYSSLLFLYSALQVAHSTLIDGYCEYVLVVFKSVAHICISLALELHHYLWKPFNMILLYVLLCTSDHMKLSCEHYCIHFNEREVPLHDCAHNNNYSSWESGIGIEIIMLKTWFLQRQASTASLVHASLVL